MLVGIDDVLATYDGATGSKIGADVKWGSGAIFYGFIPVVGDLDEDCTPEPITNTAGQISVVDWLGTGWEASTYGRNRNRVGQRVAFFFRTLWDRAFNSLHPQGRERLMFYARRSEGRFS